MGRELYFLRSSEQKIVKDMSRFAYPHASSEELKLYYEFYGLTAKDLGIYALVDSEIAGAVWCRELDSHMPTMSFAILPKYKKQGVGIFMMDQFLQEVGALYEKICIDISDKPKAIKFYERFGFEAIKENLLVKRLERKEVLRPTDGYDPSRWID